MTNCPVWTVGAGLSNAGEFGLFVKNELSLSAVPSIDAVERSRDRIIRLNKHGNVDSSGACWMRFKGSYGSCGDWHDAPAGGAWKQTDSIHVWRSADTVKMNRYELAREKENALARELAERAKREDRFNDVAAEVHQYLTSGITSGRFKHATAAGVENEYAKRKKITPYGALVDGPDLIVPIFFNGRVCSYQRIYTNGDKRFRPDSRTAGAYAVIPDYRFLKKENPDLSKETAFVCEGFATGASIHMMYGGIIFCAMSAGNLKAVALSVRKKFNFSEILIMGDDDHRSAKNTGREKAIEAAAAVGAKVFFPEFPDRPEWVTDFNDYMVYVKQKGLF